MSTLHRAVRWALLFHHGRGLLLDHMLITRNLLAHLDFSRVENSSAPTPKPPGPAGEKDGPARTQQSHGGFPGASPPGKITTSGYLLH